MAGKRTILRIAIAPLAVLALHFLGAGAWARLYPAAVVALVLGAFASSLAPGGTPLAETFARRAGENLDARGVAYCRRVTVAWTVFLALHLCVTAATAFAPGGVWALYNGVVAYVLMGAMFAGERIVRRRARRA